MRIKYQGKNIEIEAKRLSPLGMVSGLMFRTRNTMNLLFEFSSTYFASIHSFFVFFPFIAVWLDKNNRVTQIDIVDPFTFRISPKIPSVKLLEIPLNKKNRKLSALLVGKRKI